MQRACLATPRRWPEAKRLATAHRLRRSGLAPPRAHPQPGVELGQSLVPKRVQAKMGLGKILLRRRLIRHGHAPESRRPGRGDARCGILQREHFVAPQLEQFQGGEIKVGRRLGRRLIVVAAGKKIELLKQAEILEVSDDVRRRGVGGDRELQAALPGLVDQLDHAGQHLLLFEALLIDAQALGLELGARRGRSERLPWIKIRLNRADGADELGPVERHVALAVNFRESVDQRRFGVENKAVKIKDYGTDHERRLTAMTCGRGKRNSATGIFFCIEAVKEASQMHARPAYYSFFSFYRL